MLCPYCFPVGCAWGKPSALLPRAKSGPALCLQVVAMILGVAIVVFFHFWMLLPFLRHSKKVRDCSWPSLRTGYT